MYPELVDAIGAPEADDLPEPGGRAPAPAAGLHEVQDFVNTNDIEAGNDRLATPALLGEGRKLFAANCAVCHGAEGHGDGPMAKSLNPPPVDLSVTLSMPVAQDDFLYWTIAEGGAPVGSAMPAFKTTLKPDQIWAVVSALRSGDLKGK